jgi:hypothetical protein
MRRRDSWQEQGGIGKEGECPRWSWLVQRIRYLLNALPEAQAVLGVRHVSKDDSKESKRNDRGGRQPTRAGVGIDFISENVAIKTSTEIAMGFPAKRSVSKVGSHQTDQSYDGKTAGRSAPGCCVRW